MSEYSYPVAQGALQRYVAASANDLSQLSSSGAIASTQGGESGQTISIFVTGKLEHPHGPIVRRSPDRFFYLVNETATLLFDVGVMNRAADAARASATMASGHVLEFRPKEFPEHGISDVPFPQRTIFRKQLTLKTKDLPAWKPTITADDILG